MLVLKASTQNLRCINKLGKAIIANDRKNLRPIDFTELKLNIIRMICDRINLIFIEGIFLNATRVTIDVIISVMLV